MFGVELSLDGRFATVGHSGWQQITLYGPRQTMWQKEAALNVAAHMLPSGVTAVAWVDADVWFSNPEWVKDTLRQLDKREVVQLFRKSYWTDESGGVESTKPSVAVWPLTQQWISHPGFAWAMRRDLWDRAGGLYPFALSGGGDSIMAVSFQNSKKWDHLWNHIGVDRDYYYHWEAHFRGITIGCTPGTLFHEWHGSRKDRDYYQRAIRMSALDVGRDIEFDEHGLLRWTDAAPESIIKAAADYFPSRREDG